MLLSIAILGFCISSILAAGKCPRGGEIYTRGLTEVEEEEIISEHNRYRLMIARGEVPGQPRGGNLKRMVYDERLADTAKWVSDTCIVEHLYGKDERWEWVGQNIYAQWSTEYSTFQNWTQAIEGWFNEYPDFIFPDKKTRPDAVIGHYTQLVWADSDHIGCDFIAYYDPDHRYKHAKVYTCNYGPGGNIRGEAPYQIDCVDLC